MAWASRPAPHFGGKDGRELAVFEATHGTGPALAGTNRENPIGVVLSGGMLLLHLSEHDAGNRDEVAVEEVLRAGAHVTADLRATGDDRPAATTIQVADAVIARL